MRKVTAEMVDATSFDAADLAAASFARTPADFVGLLVDHRGALFAPQADGHNLELHYVVPEWAGVFVEDTRDGRVLSCAKQGGPCEAMARSGHSPEYHCSGCRWSRWDGSDFGYSADYSL